MKKIFEKIAVLIFCLGKRIGKNIIRDCTIRSKYQSIIKLHNSSTSTQYFKSRKSELAIQNYFRVPSHYGVRKIKLLVLALRDEKNDYLLIEPVESYK